MRHTCRRGILSSGLSKEQVCRDFDITVPHISRVYDYWLGGKDNFAADRELGERTRQAYPNIVDSVRANRAFLSRSVRFLTTEAGIRQFLDIGAGLPTADNIHEVAQREAPDCRIVYADNDPVVLTHARALLRSTPLGSLAYLDADLRYPDMILAEAAKTLDLKKPVAIMLLTVLQFVPDDEAYEVVERLTAACPPGSYLVISHPASDIEADRHNEMVRRMNESMPQKVTLRITRALPACSTASSWSSPASSRPRSGGRSPMPRRPRRRCCGPGWPAGRRRLRAGEFNFPASASAHLARHLVGISRAFHYSRAESYRHSFRLPVWQYAEPGILAVRGLVPAAYQQRSNGHPPLDDVAHL